MEKIQNASLQLPATEREQKSYISQRKLDGRLRYLRYFVLSIHIAKLAITIAVIGRRMIQDSYVSIPQAIKIREKITGTNDAYIHFSFLNE